MNRRSRAYFFLVFVLLLKAGSQSATTLLRLQGQLHHEVHVTLKLIQVYVTDRTGNSVRDLKVSDFVLTDNGKPQKITNFEQHELILPGKKGRETSLQEERGEEAKAPLERKVTPPSVKNQSAAPIKTTELKAEAMSRKFFLFFDFAFNDLRGVIRSKEAALSFLEKQVQPEDEVGVLSYSAIRGFVQHEYLTKDHKRIREVIEKISPGEILGRAAGLGGGGWKDLAGTSESMGPTQGPGRGAVDAEGSSAIKKSEEEIYKIQARQYTQLMKDLARSLRYIPGVKSIVYFSKGIANEVIYGSIRKSNEIVMVSGDILIRQKYEEMARELAAANCSVYAMNISGKATSHFEDRDLLGDLTLRQLADLSGGKYFDNIESYEQVMAEINHLTGTFYVLGYSISENWDGAYHKVKVKVNRPGCEIFGQTGYFNPKPFKEYTEFEKSLHLIDLALSEKPLMQEPMRFPLEIRVEPAAKTSRIIVAAKIPADKLGDVLAAATEIVALVFNDKNDIVEMKKEEKAASPSGKEFLIYEKTFSLPPGRYECRLVIRNLETGRAGIASAPLVVR